MKILLFGANGQVGWELQRSLAYLGSVQACDRHSADLEQPRAVRAAIRDGRPDVIVNAAAYTAVDKAESEPDKAERVNAKAVELLANEARRLDTWLLHYSTDYVFDGEKPGLYSETDQPNPLNTYGRTKLQGEEALRDSGCRHLVFRTSWVYSARGSNFVKTILRLAGEKDRLDVVADQTGAPTSAQFIADVSATCLHYVLRDDEFGEQAAGTFHLTADGATSWHGFARYLLDELRSLNNEWRLQSNHVYPVTTAQYKTAAKRPLNSRLDTQKLTRTFGICPPAWQFHAHRLITELGGGTCP
ncbi:MAG: dTDP-4-dehydrorhamnose reductase [Gammaproteobacteria bacterium]|nr:dTDP-4-dehydrorhamnose reductase [Gammaproteobacteria bacterium]